MENEQEYLERSFQRAVADGDIHILIWSSDYGLRADTEFAEKAANAIAQLGEKAIEPLIEALKNSAKEARIVTVQQIGLSPEPSALRDPSISFIVDRKIQKELKCWAKSPCYYPALALKLIGQQSVLPLIKYLNRPEGIDWLAKEQAIWALGEIGDRRALNYLKKHAKWFRFDSISRKARQAIRKIKKNRDKTRYCAN